MLRPAPCFLSALGVLLLPALSLAQTPCAEKSVAASAIRTREDVRAFVQCAREYVQEHGAAEARRAFHEDARWNNGQFFVYVDGNTPRGEDSRTFVWPPEPSREGGAWGPLIDRFGNSYFKEVERVTTDFGGGYVYFSASTPPADVDQLLEAYVLPIDWDGTPAVIGADIYRNDLPGTCAPDEVNAAALAAEPGEERLQELVRCAAYRFEEAGYFAAFELQNNPRWRSGSVYVFALNSRGMQYFSSNPVTIDGAAVEEWSGSPFMERDFASPAAAFGESTLYYDALNPASGRAQRKVAFVKRVMVGGEALLVGSGYYLP